MKFYQKVALFSLALLAFSCGVQDKNFADQSRVSEIDRSIQSFTAVVVYDCKKVVNRRDELTTQLAALSEDTKQKSELEAKITQLEEAQIGCVVVMPLQSKSFNSALIESRNMNIQNNKILSDGIIVKTAALLLGKGTTIDDQKNETFYSPICIVSGKPPYRTNLKKCKATENPKT